MVETFGVPVRTEIRAEEWRHLHKLAEKHSSSVGALVAELVHRSLKGQVVPAEPRLVRAEEIIPVLDAVPEKTVVVAAPVMARWRVRRQGDGWVAIAPSTGEVTVCESQEAAFDVVRAALARPVKKAPSGRQRFTAEHEAKLRRLNEEGMSDSAIARELGLHQTVISRYRKRLGLPVRGRARS